MRRMIILIAILLGIGTTYARGEVSGTDNRNLTGGPDTAALEIVCTGLINGEMAVFDVYGPDGRKIYSVSLQGVGHGNAVRRRIIGLKPGHYRAETANWDWTYDKTPVTQEMLLSGGDTAVFNFSTSKSSDLPLNYETGKLNVFRQQ